MAKKKTQTANRVDDPKSDGDGDVDLALIRETLSREARELCEVAFPVEIILGGAPDDSGLYNPETHSRLCRLKLLGVSNATAGSALGISANLISAWTRTYPKLKSDLQRAEALAVGSAAAILRRLMNGDDATAFQAVKFFLTSRSTEFKEKKELQISTLTREEVQRSIRVEMYGLRDDACGEPTENTSSGSPRHEVDAGGPDSRSAELSRSPGASNPALDLIRNLFEV